MSSSTTAQILPAALLGLSLSSFTAATIWTCTHLAIPPILQLSSTLGPATAAKQWSILYNRGKLTGPPFSLATAACFAYASYYSPSGTILGRLFAAAGVLSMSIMPYTVLLLAPTNEALLKRAKAGDKKDGAVEADAEETKELLEKWGRWNLGRAVLPLLGAAVGGVAIVMSWN